MARCLWVIGVLLGVMGLFQAQGAPSAEALAMPASELPADAANPDGAKAFYAARLHDLLPDLASEDLGVRQKAEQSFQASCWLASRPGAEMERRAVCEAMVAALAGDMGASAREFLLRELRMAGRAEAVATLAAHLRQTDPQIRDAARRALAANPAPEAGAVLRQELEQATTAPVQVELLQALLYRQDAADAPSFRRFVTAPEADVCRLALQGLACTGAQEDVQTLQEAMAKVPAALRPRATDACLRLADRLCAQGARAEALAVYLRLRSAPRPACYAAVVGIGRAGGATEIPLLVDALGDADAQLRGAAREALALLPAADVVPAITARLQTAPPPLAKALLQALAESRVAGVLPALAAAVAAPDEELRLTAIRGLGLLADPQGAPALAAAIATADGATLEAARDALALIPGEAVTAALIAAAQGASPAGKRALMATLTTRPGGRTLEFLHALAANDGDAKVRQEALRGLTRLAGEDQVPALLERLAGARSDDERDDAARALAAAARRATDVEAAAARITAALEGAPADRRGWLLRALGRVGGQTALRAVKNALTNPTPGLRDAAVRALADWPDPAACDDLLGLVRTAPEPVQRVLALRGYVRIVREAASLDPAAKLERLKAAMAAAPRPEDRKLILGGLGDVADPGALPLALECLGQAEVAGEAAVAITALCDRLRWQYPQPCRAALERVAAEAGAEADRKRATDLLADIGRYEGYLTHWLLAGPYMADKKNRKELHAMAFPPEQTPPAQAVTWTAVRTAAAPEKSWYVPIDEILGGSNRVAYLRTWVRSDSERPMRLEVGSDDGCKAWLNGTVVDDADLDRAPEPGQDGRDVTLRAGWNELLLKVSQAGGGWAAGARFRTPEGKAADDLVALASPAAFERLLADLQAKPTELATARAAADLVAVDVGTLDQRRAVLTALAASAPETVAAPAREALRKLEAGEDYLKTWELSGPYEKPGTEDAGLVTVAFAPEQADAKGVQWAPAPVSPGPDGVPVVNLGRLLGGDHRVAYLRARVTSAKAQPVRVELGSDDAVSVWLNGKLIHSNVAWRPVRPGEDKADADLRAGENTILVKVVQGAGEWGACLRLRSRDGGHLADVREAGQ